VVELEASKEVMITFETLFDILRREKSHEELQRLDPVFFHDVFEYLAQKQLIFDSAVGKTDLFSVDEREKTQTQLFNIRRVIKELYERREKKILEMALNKSRTNSNLLDTSQLLASEKAFFDKLVDLLDESRDKVLMKILELKRGSEEPAPAPTPVQPEPQATPVQSAPAATTKVKFLKEVESFVGKELETYGPYAKDAVADLPKELADALINSESAEKA